MPGRTFVIAMVCAALLLAGLAAIFAARAADPDALWKIVHGRCVPDQLSSGDPAPCTAVTW